MNGSNVIHFPDRVFTTGNTKSDWCSSSSNQDSNSETLLHFGGVLLINASSGRKEEIALIKAIMKMFLKQTAENHRVLPLSLDDT